ncbi:MAG: prepilin-type N-terminal cleavage/methylation domain-containing protein [Planctomycetota bacterium]
MPAPSKRRPTRGYTLVEVLTVVLLISVIGAIVVPMLGNTTDSALRGAAAILAADLDAARVDSIAKADDPRVLVFDTAAGSYHVAASSDTATPLTSDADGQAWQITFGQGIARDLAGVGFGAMSIGGDGELGFTAFGSLDQNADAEVVLQAGTQSIAIALDAATGEVTVGQIQ